MRRREFISLLGGAAAWPLTARAQQAERIRRIGVLLLVSASDADFQRRVAVLRQGLGELGWTEKNTTFEFRFAEGKLDQLPALAAELIHANVDVIVTQGTDSTLALLKATSTIPIVMIVRPVTLPPGRAKLGTMPMPTASPIDANRLQLKEMEAAIPVLGLRLQSVPVRDANELDAGSKPPCNRVSKQSSQWTTR
jgi:hypothetical protein